VVSGVTFRNLAGPRLAEAEPPKCRSMAIFRASLRNDLSNTPTAGENKKLLLAAMTPEEST
jgi:hypothetical protein